MMSEFQVNSIEIDGTTVQFRRAGEGEPVVYLHDELSSEWNEFLDRLSRSSEVTAIEMPGFGRSPRPPHVETVDDLAFLIGDVLHEIGVGEGLPLVGASVGGWVALEAAVRASNLISELVLIGPPGLELDGEVPADYFVMTPDERKTVLFENSDSEPKVDEDSWIRNSSMTARLVWQPRYVSPKLRYRLHRLRQPSLVLWGKQDRFLSLSYGEALAKTLGAKFDSMEGSGHFPVWDAPAATAEKINDFLGKPIS